MKNLLFKTFTFAFTALSLSVLIVACGGEETPPAPAPAADFTYTVDGTTVTFTNTTTNGSTYAWEFGDGNTSTDESPVHTYDKFAGYVVKLTATNSSGSDSKSAAVEVVAKITIDGDFSDWTNIPVASTINADNDGYLMAVTEIKVTSDLTHLYVYVKGTDDLHGFVSMYVNSDADTTTGWANKEHVFDKDGAHTASMAGADYEIDLGGPWSDASYSTELWTWLENVDNVDRAEWSFEGDQVGSADMFILPAKTGNAYEFAVVRTKWPDGLNGTISFVFFDVDTTDDGWAETGFLPNPFQGYIVHELFK